MTDDTSRNNGKTVLIIVEGYDYGANMFETKYDTYNKIYMFYQNHLTDKDEYVHNTESEYWRVTRFILDFIISEDDYNTLVNVQDIDYETTKHRKVFWIGHL